jgi:HPt (histidine-containing phosphotransfer) domain-containing protein
MGELVDMYVDGMLDRINAMQQALASGDREALRCAAHQTKGAAGSYGFDSLTDAAAALESAIRDGQPAETIQRLFDGLIQLCRRVCAGVDPAATQSHSPS